jgi:hypothetical protein
MLIINELQNAGSVASTTLVARSCAVVNISADRLCVGGRLRRKSLKADGYTESEQITRLTVFFILPVLLRGFLPALEL